MSEPWYKNAIIYGVDVRVFYDSNGDGIGDLAGLTEKLDYLADLGVTCIWVLPFYPSPCRDNGYDISAYLAVDPRCGTLQDVIRFIREAGARGIRVIFDLVMNHTSSEHPWFQAARQDDSSRFRDYYVWSGQPPPVPAGGGSIFPGKENRVWTFDDEAHAYFYHRFFHFEPTLNLANPKVVDEVERVLEFWLCFGIAGYRVDAAPHMIHRKGAPSAEPPHPHELLHRLRRRVDASRPDGCLIGEADEDPRKMVEYFGDGDQLHMLLNFYLDNALFLALATETAEPIAAALRVLPTIPESCQWCNFVRNLDELDLERLSEDERNRVFEVFAPEPEMRIFADRGIRRRAAPMLADERRFKLAFSAVFSLPGTPAIVYGDEIGLGENLALDGRMAVRAPMQWSSEANAGFSGADAERLVRPVIDSGPYSYERVNVEAQSRDEESLLSWMKRLIRLRRECPELGTGNATLLRIEEETVLAHRSEYRNRAVIAFHNFSGARRRVRVSASETGGRELVPIFGDAKPRKADDGWQIQLEPYAYAWLRAE
jgi:maltose alpha-D-glucosyltransferase/alpha-amylase